MLLTFDEPTHTYTLNGVVVPSVTQLLKLIGPDFSAIPPAVLERKRQLGADVHLACELDDLGELDDDATDPEVMGYVRGWRRFIADTGAQWTANEKQMGHAALGYAGTIDRTGYLFDREPWILDIKTALEAHQVYGVQLSAYLMLVAANVSLSATAVWRRGTVHLLPGGTYRLHRYTSPADEAAFRACLALHHWKESTK